MKKYFSKIVMMLIIAISFSAAADAQIIVKVRPGPPAYRVRPNRPSHAYVWIGGNYVWRGNQYVYTDGYWATPPQPGHAWVEGHWKHRRGGWVWIPGHWRR
jgi:WXXGXW repeat (2 copies)